MSSPPVAPVEAAHQSAAHGGTPLANVLPRLYRNGAFIVLVGTPSIKETLHAPQNMGSRLFNAKLDQKILIADVGYVRRPEPSSPLVLAERHDQRKLRRRPHPDSFGEGLASQGRDLLSGLRGVLILVHSSRAARRCPCRTCFGLWARHCSVCRGGCSVRPLCCRGVSGLHWGAFTACPSSLSGGTSTSLPPPASCADSSLPCSLPLPCTCQPVDAASYIFAQGESYL